MPDHHRCENCFHMFQILKSYLLIVLCDREPFEAHINRTNCIINACFTHISKARCVFFNVVAGTNT